MMARSKPCEREGCAGLVVQQGGKAARFDAQRYCSVSCSSSRTAHKQGRARSETCRSGRHPLVGDNVRLYDGKRSCKACAAERDANRPRRRRDGTWRPSAASNRDGAPARRRPRPRSADELAAIGPVHGPERPPWRPEGWSSTPYIPERLTAA